MIVFLILLILITGFIAHLLKKYSEKINIFLGCLLFNIVAFSITLIVNIIKIVGLFTFKEIKKFKYYNQQEVMLYFHFAIENVNNLNVLFEIPDKEDEIEIQSDGVSDLSRKIVQKVLPKAIDDTVAISIYIEDNFGKDLEILWNFMRMNFDVNSEAKLHESGININLPNKTWTDGKATSLDFAIFISGVLKNWEVQHYLLVNMYSEKNHFYIKTIDGIIIDPCCDDFGKMIHTGTKMWGSHCSQLL